jgi:hypothetical protein
VARVVGLEAKVGVRDEVAEDEAMLLGRAKDEVGRKRRV